MAHLSTTSTDYQTLLAHLGDRDQRTIGNNTVLRRLPTGALAVRLHSTDVVVIRPTGHVSYFSGGYETTTTRNRVNQFTAAPRVGVHQRDWVWYFTDATGETVPFTSGVTVDRDGVLVGVMSSGGELRAA